MKKEWVVDIKNQCEKAKVAFFFKQWGGVRKRETGRELDERTFDAIPKINIYLPNNNTRLNACA